MAQIIYAVSKSMGAEWPDNPDIAAITKGLFPSIPISGDTIIDAWGKPLVVTVIFDKEQLQLSLVSSGKDKAMGTDDDIVRYVKMFFDSIALTNSISDPAQAGQLSSQMAP